ncbi:MAG: hypothetical protein HZA02_02745 [Nitrospinae bacterium]|nr:hypothetical protein [Nitrospinota bacterium]
MTISRFTSFSITWSVLELDRLFPCFVKAVVVRRLIFNLYLLKGGEKDMFKQLFGVVVGVGSLVSGLVLSASNAFAAYTIDNTAVLADITAAGGVILAVAVAIWGFRRVKGMVR